jgi:BatD DUF11 like domain
VATRNSRPIPSLARFDVPPLFCRAERGRHKKSGDHARENVVQTGRQSSSLGRKPDSPQTAVALTCDLACSALYGLAWCFTLAVVLSTTTTHADDEPLRVEAEVGRGPHFVGQGIEFRLSVVGKRQRPKVDLPSIPNVSAWQIGTDTRPITRSAIGSIVGEENVYLTRFRLVPKHSGILQIPSVPVRVEERSGRSQPIRVEIAPVPAAGQTAAFLGGVGRFTLEARVSAAAVRVGQEFDFRITVSGPAAWGMTSPPELKRFDHVPLGLRIRSRPTETKDEPPERTFIYRLRPSRPGDAVLPPISIASFDPALSRYMTQATPSVPIRVVAVSAFDPSTIDDGSKALGAGRFADGPWIAWSLSTLALVGAYASLRVVRKRLERRRLAGAAAARRYAAGLARSLGSNGLPAAAAGDGSTVTAPSTDDPDHPDRWAARRLSDVLIRYLELGAERPPGALTPDEASLGVTQVSRSADLGAEAGRLMASSDRVLYGDLTGDSGAREFIEQARALFEALGQVKLS